MKPSIWYERLFAARLPLWQLPHRRRRLLRHPVAAGPEGLAYGDNLEEEHIRRVQLRPRLRLRGRVPRGHGHRPPDAKYDKFIDLLTFSTTNLTTSPLVGKEWNANFAAQAVFMLLGIPYSITFFSECSSYMWHVAAKHTRKRSRRRQAQNTTEASSIAAAGAAPSPPPRRVEVPTSLLEQLEDIAVVAGFVAIDAERPAADGGRRPVVAEAPAEDDLDGGAADGPGGGRGGRRRRAEEHGRRRYRPRPRPARPWRPAPRRADGPLGLTAAWLVFGILVFSRPGGLEPRPSFYYAVNVGLAPAAAQAGVTATLQALHVLALRHGEHPRRRRHHRLQGADEAHRHDRTQRRAPLPTKPPPRASRRTRSPSRRRRGRRRSRERDAPRLGASTASPSSRAWASRAAASRPSRRGRVGRDEHDDRGVPRLAPLGHGDDERLLRPGPLPPPRVPTGAVFIGSSRASSSSAASAPSSRSAAAVRRRDTGGAPARERRVQAQAPSRRSPTYGPAHPSTSRTPRLLAGPSTLATTPPVDKRAPTSHRATLLSLVDVFVGCGGQKTDHSAVSSSRTTFACSTPGICLRRARTSSCWAARRSRRGAVDDDGVAPLAEAADACVSVLEAAVGLEEGDVVGHCQVEPRGAAAGLGVSRMTAQAGSVLKRRTGARVGERTSRGPVNLERRTALVWWRRGRKAEKTTILTGGSPGPAPVAEDLQRVDFGGRPEDGCRGPPPANWSLGWQAARRNVRQGRRGLGGGWRRGSAARPGRCARRSPSGASRHARRRARRNSRSSRVRWIFRNSTSGRTASASVSSFVARHMTDLIMAAQIERLGAPGSLLL